MNCDKFPLSIECKLCMTPLKGHNHNFLGVVLGLIYKSHIIHLPIYFSEDESESEDDEQYAKFESDSDEQPTKVQSDDDEKPAKVQSDDDEKPAKFQYEEDEQSAKVQLEEDEQLAKALQESLNMGSPPRYDNGSIFQPFPFFMPAGYR